MSADNFTLANHFFRAKVIAPGVTSLYQSGGDGQRDAVCVGFGGTVASCHGGVVKGYPVVWWAVMTMGRIGAVPLDCLEGETGLEGDGISEDCFKLLIIAGKGCWM